MALEIFQRLHVMHRHDLGAVLNPHIRENLRGVTYESIGAILTIEPYAADPSKRGETWRLSPKASEGFDRHFSSVFYKHPDWNKAKEIPKDDTETIQEGIRSIVISRVSALNEILNFADTFLKSPTTEGKHLIAHDFCGEYFSPAAMLAILAHQFPAADDKEIVGHLKYVNHQKTVLGNPELAFVDAALKRKGSLVRAAWERGIRSSNSRSQPERQFNVDDALKLQRRFSLIIDEIPNSSELGKASDLPILAAPLPPGPPKPSGSSGPLPSG